jgi:hypothetical protein
VPIPQPRVAAQRATCQVGNRVQLPPLLGKVGERFAASGQQVEIAGSLAPQDFGVEGFRVALATDHFGVRVPLLITPAHPPYGPTLPLDPLDAHRLPPWSSASFSIDRKLPCGETATVRLEPVKPGKFAFFDPSR